MLSNQVLLNTYSQAIKPKADGWFVDALRAVADAAVKDALSGERRGLVDMRAAFNGEAEFPSPKDFMNPAYTNIGQYAHPEPRA